MIKRLDSREDDLDFSRRSPTGDTDPDVRESVQSILSDVREQGWDGVVDASLEFDGVEPHDNAIDEIQLQEQWNTLPESTREALRCARDRIRRYQQALMRRSRVISDVDGALGEIVRPYKRVGCYIPGGRFPLPSTVLMTAYIARVAGVDEIVICSPPGEKGEPHPVIQAAVSLVEGASLFGVGGVQAIGAMAYGAGPIPPVDLITGPGNLFVTLAKKEVYGDVEIDMLAGPSEIAIIAESGESNPAYIAADLLSQAEHDPLARSYCFSPSQPLLDDVEQEINKQLDEIKDTEVLEQALAESALVQTTDLKDAVDQTNQLAPEHLELHVDNPDALSREIEHAGAIFSGPLSPEPIGDYIAGPSHTLPTAGSARFFQPLSVNTFRRTQSFIKMGPEGFDSVSDHAETIAGMENLIAHRRSVSVRKEETNYGT